MDPVSAVRVATDIPRVTLQPPSSRVDVSEIADALVRAADLTAAYDTLTTEVTRAFNERACLFERIESGWWLRAQTRGGLRVSIADIDTALSRLDALLTCRSVGSSTTVRPDHHASVLDLGAVGEGLWTALPLTTSNGSRTVLLLAGDWTTFVLPHSLAVVLSLALQSVGERDARQRAERRLMDEYALARRLARLGTEDAVCQRVVQRVSQTLGADRVTLAVYQAAEDCLVIAAAHGPAASVVKDAKDVRVEPGSWVAGHVYASGRPVVVRDVRQLPGKAASERPYRTSSFAVVPVVAGAEVVGVLSATDKRDGSPFDRRDVLALRTVAAATALALTAARSKTEVHRLTYAATVDAVTGLFNRPYLDVRLHQEIERARRSASSLTVLMADIDDFKGINDTYGHQTGDAVLRMVGSILRSAVRVFDICARHGGDEFAILMPSSDQSSATACAERIRRRIAEHAGGDHGSASLPSLTMSIGVAVVAAGDAPADVLHRADQYLYEAKTAGKNCVCAGPMHAVLRPVPSAGSSSAGSL